MHRSPALTQLPRVNTIIDVGVGYGTPELYDAFPDARLILVEPSPEFHETIHTHILSQRYGALYPYAAGARSGTARLPLKGTRTSLLKRTSLTGDGSNPTAEDTCDVQIERLDTILSDEPLAPPSLLKIDTEGYELEVLAGAPRILERVDYLLTEVSVMRRFEDSYEFLDLCRYIQDSGFRLAHILSTPRNTQGLVLFADMLFERND